MNYRAEDTMRTMDYAALVHSTANAKTGTLEQYALDNVYEGTLG